MDGVCLDMFYGVRGYNGNMYLRNIMHTNEQPNDMVVVAKFDKETLVALKEFDKSQYFKARGHAMDKARQEMYKEAELQVRDHVTQQILFTCSHRGIKEATTVLSPHEEPEES